MRHVAVALFVAACGDGEHPPDAPKPAVVYTLDPSFGVGGSMTISTRGMFLSSISMLTTDDGIIVSSEVGNGYTYELLICRVTNAGVLDPLFAGTGCLQSGLANTSARRAVAAGRDLLVAAQSRFNDPVAGPAIFRIRPDATLDPAYGFYGALPLDPPPGPSDSSGGRRRPFVEDIVALSNDEFVVAGGYSGVPERWARRVIGTTLEPAVRIDDGGVLAPLADGFVFLKSRNAAPTECPPAPCAQGEVCRYAVCTPPPPACQTGCPTGRRCDELLRECMPSTIDERGTDITHLSNTLAPIDRSRVSVMAARAAYTLPGSRALVIDYERGGWLLSSQGARDFDFGDGGTSTSAASIADMTTRADGGIVAAAEIDYKELGILELTASGKKLASIPSPVPGVKITAVHQLSDSQLLAAGELGADVVVMRLVRTVP